MALTTDPKALFEEIEKAEKFRDGILKKTRQLIQVYVGNWYSTKFQSKPAPENLIFAFVAGIMTTLVFDNPAVTIASSRAISWKAIADGMKNALNSWLKGAWVKDEFEELAVDLLFGFGVSKVGLETRGDFANNPYSVAETFTMQPLHPYLVRVEPECYFMDHQAKSFRAARFMGDRFQRDLDELKGDERYDQTVVKSLQPDDSKPAVSVHSREQLDSGDRGRVTLYQVYFAESRQIGVMVKATSGEPQWIRPLQAYKGPPTGPYVLFGAYPVPGQPYPLSPLAAIGEQHQTLNAHVVAAANEAATHKSMTIVDGSIPQLVEAIEEGKSGGIASVPGFRQDSVTRVETGGTSAFRLQFIEWLRGLADRVIGKSEQTRGRTVGHGTTATEVATAAAAENERVEFVHSKFRQGVRRSLNAAAWFMFYDQNVVMPISWRDPITGQQEERLFMGGIQPGQEAANWMEFYLDIEPNSMRFVDPQTQQQQAMETFQFTVAVAPLIIQMPYINWWNLIDDFGRARNIDGLAERILNEQGLALIQGMAGQMALLPAHPGMMGAQGGQGAGPQMPAMGANGMMGGGGGGGNPMAIMGPRPNPMQGAGPAARSAAVA